MHTTCKIQVRMLNAHCSCRYTVDREHGDVPGSTNKSSSHHKIPQKLMSGPEQQQMNRSQRISKRSTDNYAPPASPIHSALGQVSTRTGCNDFYSLQQFCSGLL